MNNLIIYTDKPFTKEKGVKQLKERFPKYKIVNETNDQLLMGKFPNNFSLQLNSKVNRHNTIEPIEDVKASVEAIPNKDSIFSDFLYNKVITAKRVIKVLLEIYPELWLEDCDFEWIGSGADYLKSHHMDDDLKHHTPDVD